MGELLLPVDVEDVARDELLARMPAHGYEGLVVATRLPAPRPGRFMRLVAVGGAQRDMVTDAPTLRLEAYGGSEDEARRMAAYALACLQAAARAGRVGGATCYAAAVVALPQNLPNPAVPDRYRFITTVALQLRRTRA